MKGGGMILIVILVGVIVTLSYYNFQQQKTIEILNEEIFEQARLRHNLILEKHIIENAIISNSSDTMTVE